MDILMILDSERPKNIKQLDLPTGIIYLEGPASSGYITPLLINATLSNLRSPTRQKEALMLTANSPEGIVYLARHQEEIIGYVMFHYPSQYTRWNRHPRILELGAVEVSSTWQHRGIASELLKLAFANNTLEEYIVITTEFHWHWDLKGTGLNVWSYQKMLIKLFGKVGFKKRRTDDPEILEHPANMLLARSGKMVNKIYLKAFEEMIYQQSLVR